MFYYHILKITKEISVILAHTGLISIQQIANAPVLLRFLPLSHSLLGANNTKAITTAIAKVFGTSGNISIDKQLKPMFVKNYENITSFNPSNACVSLCPILWRSLFNMIPNLGIIGNVPKSTGILILHGENDSLTPVQEAILLQQRLTDVNHPDHTLITYPNLGHGFYPSSQWIYQKIIVTVCLRCRFEHLSLGRTLSTLTFHPQIHIRADHRN